MKLSNVLFFHFKSLQVNSPYPLSVTRESSPSTTKVTFRISVLSDYHCPPEQPFTDLNVSFSSSITHQEELVSVSFLETDSASCPDVSPGIPGSPDTPLTRGGGSGRGSAKPLSSTSPPWMLILVAILTIILATLVICVALNKSSANGNSGFRAHLPPSSSSSTILSPSNTPMTSPQQPSLHASSYPGPAQQTPSSQSFYAQHPRQTPLGAGGSGGPTTPFNLGLGMSPHRRTGLSSSPGQHGLFSRDL